MRITTSHRHPHRKPRRMPWHRRERQATAEREMEATVQRYQAWTEAAREEQRPAEPVEDGA